jgi:hypothetical protein
MKRKAAFIVVSDDEDTSPVAGPSNTAAKSLPEVLLRGQKGLPCQLLPGLVLKRILPLLSANST